MDAVDPNVLAGRDPAWREAWEEQIDAPSRQRIEDAVNDAEPLRDPALEPFVYGLIARRRRQHRWRMVQAAILFAIVGLWVVLTTVVRPSPLGWFWTALLILAVVVVPLLLRRERQALDRAEDALTSRRG